MNLNGKTVLITGGRRIGAKLAIRLAEHGANLALSYFTSGNVMNAVAEDCRTLGVRAETLHVDLRSSEEAERLIEWTVTSFGAVDVLVNLTSIYTRTPFASLSPDDFESMLTANLSAPYWTSIAAARAMLKQPVVHGLRGKIIHFTDWAVDRPYRDFLPYLIAKGGLATLTRALAVELAPTITVNAIAPGTVEPPPSLSEKKRQQIRESSALGRIGSPEDVIRAVLYLVEGTDFVTGEILRVDGGRFLGSIKELTSDLD